MKHEAQKRQLKKIAVLIIRANCLYFIWDALVALLNHRMDSIHDIVSMESLKNLFLFNESPTAGHLWYLNAILYVLVIVALADKFNLRKLLYLSTTILLIVDLAFGTYSLLLFHREFTYIYVRNFLCVGIPYFCIGCLIRGGFLRKLNRCALIWLMFVFVFTSIFEKWTLLTIGANATRDHYISSTFLAVSVFLFALQSDWNNVFCQKWEDNTRYGCIFYTLSQLYSWKRFLVWLAFINGFHPL